MKVSNVQIRFGKGQEMVRSLASGRIEQSLVVAE